MPLTFSRLIQLIFVCYLLVNHTTTLFAQAPQYFKNKYLFPLRPPVYLTGNMGEIRPNHFHAGLDVLGDSRTPVYATYDGYIGRIKASTYGYGNVIYITHPTTNHITVYAHLSRFSSTIGQYVRKKQYEATSFEVDLYPQPQEVPIKKGQLLGYVGNTGASFGAHLHYEIRNGNEAALNPLLFFENLVQDRLAPIIQNIGIVPLSPEARLSGKYQEQRYQARKQGNNHYTIPTIQAYGAIGFELRTYDIANQASNTYATTKALIKVDGKTLFQYDINNYPMDEAYAMNAHINYPFYKKTRLSYQKLYSTDGNYLDIYQHKNQGKLRVKAGQLYDILIEAHDVHGNVSTVAFKVKGVAPPKAQFVPDYSPSLPRITPILHKETLLFKVQGLRKLDQPLTAYFNGIQQPIPLAYMEKKQAVFLWDINQGLPDAVRVGEANLRLDKYRLIPSNTVYGYRDTFFNILFANDALFDTTAMKIQANRYNLQIGEATTPLARSIEVIYHYKKAGLSFQDRDRWAVYYQSGRHLPTTWTDSTVTFQTRYLGNFKIRKDVTPPRIVLRSKSTKRCSFSIADGLAGIRHFKATLDGRFILMQHESKANLIWTDPAYPQPLKGTFVLRVWDKMGNMAFYETQL